MSTLRWEGEAVRKISGEDQREYLASHLVSSHRLGQIIGVNDAELLSLLFHDLGEIVFGDIGVEKVRELKENYHSLVAKIIYSKIPAIKEAILLDSLKTHIDECLTFDEFIQSIDPSTALATGDTSSIRETLKNFRILDERDNFLDFVALVKKMQDLAGENMLIRTVLEYFESTEPEAKLRAQEFIRAMFFGLSPIVKNIERIETTMTFISPNGSDYIEGLVSSKNFEDMVWYFLNSFLEVGPDHQTRLGHHNYTKLLHLNLFMVLKLNEISPAAIGETKQERLGRTLSKISERTKINLEEAIAYSDFEAHSTEFEEFLKLRESVVGELATEAMSKIMTEAIPVCSHMSAATIGDDYIGIFDNLQAVVDRALLAPTPESTGLIDGIGGIYAEVIRATDERRQLESSLGEIIAQPDSEVGKDIFVVPTPSRGLQTPSESDLADRDSPDYTSFETPTMPKAGFSTDPIKSGELSAPKNPRSSALIGESADIPHGDGQVETEKTRWTDLVANRKATRTHTK